jgi:hypothetical protein
LRIRSVIWPDGVVGTHANPVWNGAVLPHLLRQLLLDPESLVRRLRWFNKRKTKQGLIQSNSSKLKMNDRRVERKEEKAIPSRRYVGKIGERNPTREARERLYMDRVDNGLHQIRYTLKLSLNEILKPIKRWYWAS